MKDTEKTKQQIEKEFTNIALDTQLDTFFLFDPTTGKALRWNKAFRDASGYTDKEIAFLPAPASYYSLEDLERAKSFINHVLKGGSGAIELKLISKNGSKTLTEYRVSVIYDKNSKPKYMVSIGRDISERKKAEKELKASNAFLHRVMDESPFAMWISDKKGTMIRSNRALRKTLNVTNEQLIGKYNILEDTNLDLQGVRSKVEAVFNKKEPVSFSMEWLANKAGDVNFARGKDVFIDVSMFPVLDSSKNITNVVCQWVDVTKRKQAEVALSKSESQKKAILNGIGTNIAFVNDKLEILWANKCSANSVGKIANEMLGKKCHELWADPLKPCDRCPTLKAFKTKKSEHSIMTTPDGRIWDEKGEPVFDNEGKLIGVVEIAQDITEQKKAEEKLEEYRNNLEKIVAERTRALEQANKELESFSYSVSHDLRTPLRGIDGFSKILLDTYSDKIDATGQDYLSRVRKATQHMGRLIDDILLLSRITRKEIGKKQINMNPVIESILDELRQSEPDRTITCTIHPELTAIADKNLLEIAIQNLLDNAWKFTKNKREAIIEFGETTVKGKNTFFIRDNGIGFDMQYADKLFEPFMRLHTDKKYPGTGIGLATVKRIIKKHGGEIWPEAKLGKGATFYFTLG